MAAIWLFQFNHSHFDYVLYRDMCVMSKTDLCFKDLFGCFLIKLSVILVRVSTSATCGYTFHSGAPVSGRVGVAQFLVFYVFLCIRLCRFILFCGWL